MDIRATALAAGFAEEDLTGGQLEHYCRIVNESSWDSGTTLATLGGGIASFKQMLIAHDMNASAKDIFTHYTTSFQNRY